MIAPKGSTVREQFQSLAAKWREEIKWSSNLNEMVMHPAYQQIIGLGPDVIPILLDEMLRKPDHWSWALRALTGANPVKEEHRGDLKLMAADWLDWAKQRGYIL